MTANRQAQANFSKRAIKLLTMSAIFIMATTAAYAQYQVSEWANFEDGKLPTNITTIGGNWQQRMTVVSPTAVTDQPASFQDPEVGNGVLKLEVHPNANNAASWQLGLAVGDVIDRSKLSATGRALFQADFYIPDDGHFPSLAVMAMEPPKNAVNNHVESISGSFYRFGMTKDNRLYYSQVVPGDATARKFEQDTNLIKQIPTPGWHRFALVCEGPDTLRCFVDGREAGFSPIKDNAMKSIMVGLLIAEQDRSYTAYADNISIQMSDDAPALPASPYDKGWSVAAGSSAKASGAGVSTAVPTANVTTALAAEWLPPVQAWQKAQQDKKGLLLYFYAPGVQRVEKVNQMLASDAGAKAYMTKHACARVDVNQLEGGSIAKKYGIFKVPTFLVISPDAQQYKKATPGQNQTWAEIEAQLAPL